MRRTTLVALVAALALLVPGLALAETITVSGACDLSSITDSNCAPGAGSLSGGTPSADDLFVVNGGQNEIISISLTGASSGTMTLSHSDFPGETEAIDWDASGQELQQAMQNLGFARDYWRIMKSPASSRIRLKYNAASTQCQDMPAAGWNVDCTNLVGSVCTGATNALTEEVAGAAPTGTAGALTISGDFTFDSTTLNTGLYLECQSSMTIDPGVTVTLPQGYTDTALGDGTREDGIWVEAGATLDLDGQFLSLSTSPATVEDDQSDDTIWTMGTIVPCATGTTLPLTIDCTTNPDVIGIEYNDTYEAFPNTGLDAAPYYALSLAAIDTSTDVLRVFDPLFGAGESVPGEVFNFYEITAVGSTSPNLFIKISVHQGDQDQDGWPLARREIDESVITTTALAAGDTSVFVDSGVIAVGDERNYSGRCLTVSDGSGVPVYPNYRIMNVVDGGAGADEVRLLDVRGSRSALAVGQDVWLEYCHTAGDTFEIIRPVTLLSATAPTTAAASIDSTLALSGSGVSIEETVIDDIRQLWFDGASSVTLARSWMRDCVANDENNACIRIGNSAAVDIGPGYFKNGGSAISATEDDNYGVHFIDSGLVRIADSRWKGNGDDSFVQHSIGTDSSDGISMRRVITGDKADSASSGAWIDSKVGATFDLQDVVVFNDTSSDGANMVLTLDSAACVVKRGAFIGMGNGMWNAAGGADGLCSAQDLLVAGTYASNQLSGGSMALPYTDRFVIRDWFNVFGPDSSIRAWSAETASIRNGYALRGVASSDASYRGPSNGPAEVNNVGVIDYEPEGGGNMIAFNNGTFGFDATYDKFTIAHTGWAQGVTRLVFFASASPGSWKGMMLTGLQGASADTGFNQNTAPVLTTDHLGPYCWWNNVNSAGAADDIVSAAVSTNLRTVMGAENMIRNIDPQFYDVEADQFWMPEGSRVQATGCGMQRGAGIPSFTWFNKVLKTEPEYQGPNDGLGGGGGGGDQIAW